MARVVQGEEDSDEELELSSSKGPTFSTATTSPTFSQTPQFGSAQATLSVALVKFGKDDEEDEPSQSVTAPSFGSASLGNVPEPTNSSRPTARSALIFEGEEEEEENYRADAAKQAPLTATAASDNQSTSSTKPQEPPRSYALSLWDYLTLEVLTKPLLLSIALPSEGFVRRLTSFYQHSFMF